MLRFYGVFLLLILSTTAFGQSKKELEKKRQQIQKDIEYTNKQLSQTRKYKSTTINELVTLNKKINYRSELITNINTEIVGVDGQITYAGSRIDSLQKRMAEVKKHYGELLFYSYKNQSALSALSFIFSAENFNQAFKRIKYLQQLSEYRQYQRQLISELQDSLNVKRNELQGVKQEKTTLLVKQKHEVATLDKEKKEQVTAINNLSAREKRLKEDLKAKQQQEAKLNKMIEEAIRKEIEAARLAAKKKAASTMTASTKKTTLPSSSALLATPEAQKLSADFETNRGHLPWPVSEGFISSGFGRHAHPVWKDVVVNNSGIDINSSRGAKVTAIFAGRVSKVLMIMNKYAVIVQHGEYFTVYSNLQQVSVKSGDLITTKQVLGIVQTDDEGKSEVHLEIWKGSNKMDPEGWIMARR
jgi:septal ring factor EnvC (AmiA/AmiB activator)